MELSVCLKALGDPTRFSIFQHLLARKHCTRSLARTMEISEAAVSQHLKILHEAGLVYKEKHGYHMHYFPVQEAMDFLAESFDDMRRSSLDLDRELKDQHEGGHHCGCHGSEHHCECHDGEDQCGCHEGEHHCGCHDGEDHHCHGHHDDKECGHEGHCCH